MSLILDALKKSEQERRRERGPDLQTIHQSGAVVPRHSRARWGWLILAVANIGALAVWWWLQRAPAPSQPVATAAPAAAPVAAPAPLPANPPSAAQPAAPAAAPESQFTRIEPRVDAATPVEEYTDLSADVRSALPAMTFSFHVYSADPRNRTIIINNQRLREGDDVAAGVVLESITEDGVILAMDHRRIHINVLTGW